MNVQSIAKSAAGIFLILAIGAILAKYIPGFSVPGNSDTCAMMAIASAIVGATR